MLVLLVILYFFHNFIPGANPAPTSLPISASQPSDSFTFAARQNIPDLELCKTCSNMRSTWNIAWSCLSTTFICTWVTVHPDVPHPSASWWFLARRCIKLMIWAFLTPELYVYWAFGQRMSAKKATKYFEGKGYRWWKMSHGFFLAMNGFYSQNDNGPVNFEKMKSLLENNKATLQGIDKADLEDKSKADGLKKGIAILQVTWFVAQCIARGAQRLPLTELEVITLALASINGVTYFLWWEKPMDVQRPICLRSTSGSPLTWSTMPPESEMKPEVKSEVSHC
ncbi:hypothetical protein NLJ89_g10238 [Agrocybe chaxingu]|uniref:Uncharacterized protein n=1 Tax=Agrocybe chaxingu TaxID=84603 RepID=A0A9W8MST9_9AGAR|nr:hypothetical protein NLJ89_g10238 [Agrocybe chaxingu]